MKNPALPRVAYPRGPICSRSYALALYKPARGSNHVNERGSAAHGRSNQIVHDVLGESLPKPEKLED